VLLWHSEENPSSYPRHLDKAGLHSSESTISTCSWIVSEGTVGELKYDHGHKGREAARHEESEVQANAKRILRQMVDGTHREPLKMPH